MYFVFFIDMRLLSSSAVHHAAPSDNIMELHKSNWHIT